MEKRIIQLGRQIKKKVGSELRRAARTYLDKHDNTCVRCNREDVPIKSMHVCHVGPLLSDKVEEDTRQLMGEYQSSGQLNFKTYDDVIEFEGMFKKKMVEQTLVKHAEQRICTILACAECNGKYEREDPSKIKRASSWERSRYGTLIPCRDAGRASEKSARPSDIRYFMGVRGNDTNVSDSDSTNANGGSVSDSDDIYDDYVSDSDSSGEDNSVFSEGHAFETPLSDSPGSKRQRVGSESEDESPQNKKVRRSCVGRPDYSHNGQNLSKCLSKVKRLSKDKIDVEPAETHFSRWKTKLGVEYDNTTEEWGCKTRPICHEKCAKVWDSYEKFSANLDNKHRFNKSTFQNVMKECGFVRVQSVHGNSCGYKGHDWYYTNLKVTGSPL